MCRRQGRFHVKKYIAIFFKRLRSKIRFLVSKLRGRNLLKKRFVWSFFDLNFDFGKNSSSLFLLPFPSLPPPLPLTFSFFPSASHSLLSLFLDTNFLSVSFILSFSHNLLAVFPILYLSASITSLPFSLCVSFSLSLSPLSLSVSFSLSLSSLSLSLCVSLSLSLSSPLSHSLTNLTSARLFCKPLRLR